MSEKELSGLDAWKKVWEKAEAGTVAVVDCREEIPCNPCEKACGRGAIVVGEDICALPRYDPDSCDGCGRCVALCPGMAVFMLDRSGGGGKAHLTVAYEMKEDMKVGAEAWALDGEGKTLGRGKIVKTAKMGGKGGTVLVTLEVPEGWALKVRGVRDRVMSVEEPHEVEGPPEGEDCSICRCEEVSGSQVRELAESGFKALNALRRISRAGLGYCQGRFCQSILAEELSAVSCREREELGTFKVRPPVRPVKLSRLGGEDG